MPSLRDAQLGFAAAIMFADGGATASVGIVAAGLTPAQRIAIYRSNVLSNYRKALAATYPVVQRRMGRERFAAATEAFVRAYPSSRGDVNRYGGELARFLSSYAPTRKLAYLPDLARLEWAIDQANIAADAGAIDLAALATVAPSALGELRFKLHPSARLVASSYPIFRIWRANQPAYDGDGRIDPDAGGDALLIARSPNGVTVERLSPGAHAFLVALAHNLRLADALERALAAEASFDLSETLKSHVAAQTIGAIRVPPAPISGVPT